MARCPLDRIVRWQRYAYETPEDVDAVHDGVFDMKLRFDRGTILLTEPLHDVNLVEAPGVLWDPRVSAHRAPASRYPALRSWLREAGVEFEDIAALPRLTPDAWSTVTLRPYQEAALSAWELAQHRGVVALPTGSGKTRLAIAAIRRTGLSALCLVPTRVLLDQWSREITTVYGGAIGRYGDGARQMAPLTVATFESAYRHMARLGDRFDLLIVDEVHHFGSGLRDEALEMMVAHARLGLTATPPREAAVVNRLAELVGPIVFELAVGDLAGGFLASFGAITLHLELSPEERSAYSALHALFTNVHTEFRQLAPGASWADWSRHAGRSAEGRRALTVVGVSVGDGEAGKRRTHPREVEAAAPGDHDGGIEPLGARGPAARHLLWPEETPAAVRQEHPLARRFFEGELGPERREHVVHQAALAIDVAGVLGDDPGNAERLRQVYQQVGELGLVRAGLVALDLDGQAIAERLPPFGEAAERLGAPAAPDEGRDLAGGRTGQRDQPLASLGDLLPRDASPAPRGVRMLPAPGAEVTHPGAGDEAGEVAVAALVHRQERDGVGGGPDARVRRRGRGLGLHQELGADDGLDPLAPGLEDEPDDPAQIRGIGEPQASVAQGGGAADQHFGGDGAIAEGKGGVGTEFGERSH